MITRLYTDGELEALRTMRKRITNPHARWLEKPTARPAHKQRMFRVSDAKSEDMLFSVYLRQSLLDQYNFSCGIQYHPKGGKSLMLARYNGPSHRHGDLVYCPHIHKVAESVLAAGRRPDSEASRTDRFATFDGALYCLVQDYNISGIETRCDQPRLFQ